MVFWLCKFILEACRRDKESYRPDTLYSLYCSLFWALKENDRADIKPYEDPTFAVFTSTLDARMMALKSTGEYQIRRAEVISEELEEILWQKGLLGESTPQQLLDTLVFTYRPLFCIVKWPRTPTPSPPSITDPTGGTA